MIAQLRGIILEKQPPHLIVEVLGMGYELDAPMSTFYQLPEVGQEITLLTHFIVREDAHYLFGFYTKEEKELFRALLKVNGVGPRLALTILSGMAPHEFVACIMNNDAMSLIRVPGIGKKTAERLVMEMRDKLNEWQMYPGVALAQAEDPPRHQTLQDAISALVVLGFKQNEANKMVNKIDDGMANSEILIKLALKEMM